jgi:hypothetical protein
MKKLITLLLLLILSIGAFPALAQNNISVIVNGTEVSFDSQPFLEQDRIMVPFRAISEALGITVEWNETDQSITGYVDNREYLHMKIGSTQATINFILKETDVAPVLKNNRAFIPLRFFSEAFGAKVAWDEENYVANIIIKPLFDMDFDRIIPLLNNRLSVSMPNYSTIRASVQVSKISEILSPKTFGHQIVITAEESFFQSSGDLKEDVKYLGDFEPSGEIIKKNGFELIRYTNMPDIESNVTVCPSIDSIFPFERYLLKDSNGMLIKITLSTPFSSGQHYRNQYYELADKILDSLKITNPLNTAVHSQSIYGLNINLFEGYATYGLDERGAAIQKITDISNVDKTSYLHFFRNIENNEMSEHPDKNDLKLSREVDGVLMEYKFKWQIYSDGTMYAEVIDECTGKIVYSLYGFAETEADQNDIIKMTGMIKFLPSTGAKPVIYLYPETETEVSVDLQLTGDFTFTYPQYNNGWKVTARPDGTILSNGKEYSYLFWEGIFEDFPVDFKEGFVVKGSESAEFLQQVLSKMGLTPKEYNEFIVYWAPKMQENEYNKVYFAKEEYEEAAKLTISPTPDSILRVFMVYEKAEEGTVLPPQKIEPFERKGFTVVEWGGKLIEA